MVTILALLGCVPNSSDGAVHDSPIDTGGSFDTADSNDSGGDTAIPDPCASLPADDPCCVDSTDYLLPGADFNAPVTGVFSAVPEGPGQWTLTTADGSTHQLWLEGEGLGATLVPDLAALGTVVVSGTASGLFGEEYMGGTFTIYDQGGTLLFALGNRPDGAASALDGAIAAGPDTCPDRPPGPDSLSVASCFETIRNYPLEFTDGTTSITLYQGESGELAGVEITVLLALQAGTPTFQCSDVHGGWANWVMIGGF